MPGHTRPAPSRGDPDLPSVRVRLRLVPGESHGRWPSEAGSSRARGRAVLPCLDERLLHIVPPAVDGSRLHAATRVNNAAVVPASGSPREPRFPIFGAPAEGRKSRVMRQFRGLLCSVLFFFFPLLWLQFPRNSRRFSSG